mmetsp:Transcript_51250/g.151094  ORF Transcript_51250/g.151094 Transcript_51250/m.151094 type:complete len:282 (-) Transcript_51250:69-914(-)
MPAFRISSRHSPRTACVSFGTRDSPSGSLPVSALTVLVKSSSANLISSRLVPLASSAASFSLCFCTSLQCFLTSCMAELMLQPQGTQKSWPLATRSPFPGNCDGLSLSVAADTSFTRAPCFICEAPRPAPTWELGCCCTGFFGSYLDTATFRSTAILAAGGACLVTNESSEPSTQLFFAGGSVSATSASSTSSSSSSDRSAANPAATGGAAAAAVGSAVGSAAAGAAAAGAAAGAGVSAEVGAVAAASSSMGLSSTEPSSSAVISRNCCTEISPFALSFSS